MYEKLLLTAGGGVIDRMQQSEQDNSAVLAIGLGGTGIDCLRNLKQKMYNRVKPDDPTATVPQYSHIKYLAVDTDLQDMKKKSEMARQGADGSLGAINPDTEFFDLSYAARISELFSKTRTQLAKNPVYREWLQFDKIKAGTADNGAGGIRQLGRFLLLQKAQEFVTKVQQLVTQAKTGLGECNVYVHIYSGISGGTGAGTFLDVCYLVQKALESENKLKVLGYFFLPDVNMAKPSLPREVKQFIGENGYASLQELDYCMNFPNNGDEWHQNYGAGLDVHSSKQPVDLCHLISATTAGGAVIPEAYQYAMNVVTDYTMDFLVKSTSPTFNLESHLSNIERVKGQVTKTAGSSYDYVVLGAASTMVPFKQMLTYLAAKVFEGFAGVRKLVPSEQASDQFRKDISFEFDPILHKMENGVNMSFPVPDVKPNDALENERLYEDWFANLQSKAQGALQQNFENLSAALTSYSTTVGGGATNMRSLIGSVLDAIRPVMVDPKRGPYYAAALVRGLSGSDLLAAAQGIRETALTRLNYERQNLNDIIQPRYEQAKTAFRGSNFLNRNRTCNECLNATRNLVMSDTRCVEYQHIVNLMDVVSDQLRKMADAYMDPFAKTIGNLFDTFEADRAELEVFADRKNPYELPLVTMQEMMPSLQQTVKSMDIDGQASEFMSLLLGDEGLKGWMNGGDEALLSHLVSDYFVNRFQQYSNRSLTSFLEDKYQTTDPDKLSDYVRNDLLQTVNKNASPLLATETGYTTADASEIGYFTVPQTAPVVIEAAKKLTLGSQELVIRETDVRDRISILRFLAGVPMWGYRGVQQYELENATKPTPGKHLYEPAEYVDGVSSDAESRDWSLLPSPTPLSAMNANTSTEMRARAEVAKDLYQQSVDAKVVEKVNGRYEIHALAESFVQRFRAAFDAAKNQPNDVKYEAKTTLEGMLANPEFEKPIPTLSTETGGESEQDICIDRIDQSLVFQKLISNELKVRQELQDDLKALEPKVDTDADGFRKALFSGVIVLDIPLITYTDKEFGDETLLSKPQMPHGGAPLYQAYLTFKSLDADVRSSIVEQAGEVLNMDRLPAEVTTACQAVKAELDRKKDYVMIANATFPQETQELKSFIKELENALKLFTAQYFIKL